MGPYLVDVLLGIKHHRDVFIKPSLARMQLYPLGGLTLSQTGKVFTCLQLKSFENTVGQGEIARHEQFLLVPQCFLPIWRTFYHFHQI